MRCFTFGRIDWALAKPFTAAARLLMAATGASQHTVARILLLASNAAWIAYAAIHDHGGWLVADLVAFGFGTWWILWRALPDWEHVSDRLTGDILPGTVLDYRWMRWGRPLGVIAIPLQQLIGFSGELILVTNIVYAMGLYAVTMYGPRPRPWWQHLTDLARLRPAPIRP